jgi:aminopeptidase N
MRRHVTHVSTATLMVVAFSGLVMAQEPLRLPIGDPARKDRTAPIVLDAITDTASGSVLTPAELAAKLDDVRVVFIGESHTDMAFHRVQYQVIKELQKRGRSVLIGLEMYPYTEQASLDVWNQGKEGEADFLAKSRWYKNWGYHWDYYRDIFLFARDHAVKMFAVNTPREVVTAVRKKGFQNLTPQEAAAIPPKIDTDNEEHKRLFRAFFASDESMMHTMSAQMFDGMFAAQCTWDASMGYNAVQALKKFGGPKSVMVVLIGSGHVAYGLGIQRQAALWFDGKMASVIPIAVANSVGKPTGAVQASYADYLWGLPAEDEPLYPSLGFSTRDQPGATPLVVIDVPKESSGAAAGVKVGDVLVSLDGTPLADRETLNRTMSERRWADSSSLVVRRGTETLTLTLVFRRPPPKPEGEGDKK